MSKMPIYMDYSATTPVDVDVKNCMMKYLDVNDIFGNPASRSHGFGWQAEHAVEEARKTVAGVIGAHSKEIIWTSGATESNNLAILGCMQFYASKGKHLITCKTEHKAVLDPCRHLEHLGYDVTYLDVQEDGLVDLQHLKDAIRDDTILVSIMHVNNEIGVIQPVEKIAKICEEKGIFFHMDAAQSIGKVTIDVTKYPVHLISMSAHKSYGPKGIGALYVRRKPKVRLSPMMLGGGHERGLRSGTLPTHQIVGMAKAFEKATQLLEEENKRFTALKDRFLEQIKPLEEIYVNGSLEQRVPSNLNISFNFVEGESLMMALKNIAVSSGSACTSASLEPSYVLRALGRSDELAHSSIRFTFGRFTTAEEVDYVAKLLVEKVNKLRALSPLWDMHKSGVDLDSFEWIEH